MKPDSRHTPALHDRAAAHALTVDDVMAGDAAYFVWEISSQTIRSMPGSPLSIHDGIEVIDLDKASDPASPWHADFMRRLACGVEAINMDRIRNMNALIMEESGMTSVRRSSLMTNLHDYDEAALVIDAAFHVCGIEDDVIDKIRVAQNVFWAA